MSTLPAAVAANRAMFDQALRVLAAGAFSYALGFGVIYALTVGKWMFYKLPYRDATLDPTTPAIFVAAVFVLALAAVAERGAPKLRAGLAIGYLVALVLIASATFVSGFYKSDYRVLAANRLYAVVYETPTVWVARDYNPRSHRFEGHFALFNSGARGVLRRTGPLKP